MMTDVRRAVRSLIKTPAYSMAVVAVLTLGIGANTAVFSAIDQILIRPLPYHDPDRLAAIWEDFSAFGTPRQRVSPGTFFDWQKRNRSFSELAAYHSSGLTATGDGEPEALDGIAATANLIPALGVRPLLGRTFIREEESPGNRIAVISHRLWQRRLAGDLAVVGRTLRLSGEPYEVIGVMPPDFRFPDGRCDYWIPIGLAPDLAARRNSHFLYVVGRLQPGRTWADARAEMNGIATSLASQYPSTNSRVGVTVSRLKDDLVADADTSLLVLLGAAGCLLLIACANVANLALAHNSARRHDISIRMALGASRRRITAEILVEGLILAAAGAAASLVAARWGILALQWLVPSGMAGVVQLHVGRRAVLFTAAAATCTAVFFSAAPILLQTAGDTLSSVGRGSPRTAGQPGGRLRQALVVFEVALALVLLVVAGLLVETLFKLRTIDTGFNAARVLTAVIEVPYPKYADALARTAFFQRVIENVHGVKGVEKVGLTSDLPYTSRGNTMSIRIEGREQESALGRDALFRLVSQEYLQAIGARLKAGRLLDLRDGSETAPAVVVNESFARQYFPGSTPLGHRIDSGTGGDKPLWMTIVGVLADVRERGAALESKPAVYVPFTQTAIGFFQPSEIAVRTSVDPLSIANALRRAVWAVDPEQPVSDLRTMDEIVENDSRGRQQVLSLVGGFSAVALLLAVVGLYSVLSYTVAQTRREIGVRMTIGASPTTVVKMILARAATLVAAGVGLGLASAIGVTRVLASLLYEVSPLDPRVLVGVSVTVAGVAMLAALLPARRAAATDPLVILRDE
jgi:predicted permease